MFAIAAAVVAGPLVDLLVPYPQVADGVPRGLVGFLVGVGAAMLAALRRGQTDALVEQLAAIVLGGVLGGLACLIAIAASYATIERRGWLAPQAVVQASLPFAAAAPVAYFVAILLGG